MQPIVLWSLVDTTDEVAIPFCKVVTTHSRTPAAKDSGSQGETPHGGMSLGLERQSSTGEDELCQLASDSVSFPKDPTVESRPAERMRTKKASGETESP